jgi:ribosome-binding ATPase YchF (GTP1/OBG family)
MGRFLPSPRDEIIHSDEQLDLGARTPRRPAGKLRFEGTEYPVSDGDVVEIRFNALTSNCGSLVVIRYLGSA